MQHSIRSTFLALVALPALMLTACTGGSPGAAAATTQGVTANAITIAAFGPLTGPSAWIGLGTRDGLSMAFDEINKAGGIHGRMLRLQYFDDGYQVAQAQTVVRRIQSDTKPFMVYSGTGSTVFDSVANFLRNSGLPVYNGFSGDAVARSNPEVKNMFHGQAVSSTHVTADLIVLLKNLGVKRVSVIHSVGAWGVSVCDPTVKSMKTDLGLEPTGAVQTYAEGDTDFSGQLIALRNDHPQVIINCGHFPEAGLILKQAKALGVPGLFIGDTAQGNNSVWQQAGAAGENFIFNWYSPVFLTDTTGPMADFVKRYKAKYPDAPVGRPAHSDTFSYGDGYIIAKALEAAGKNLTQEGFIKAMKAIDGFQPRPINAVASFANTQNDGFQKTVWMRVQNGQAVLVNAGQMAQLKALIAGS